MSAERTRETLIATLERIREGLAMAIDGIEQLIKLHQEGLTPAKQPSMSEADTDALPWTPYESGGGEWAFVDPQEDDPEEIKALRARLADYMRAKGKGYRKAVFIGKYRISFSGDRNQFFRRSLIKR